MNGNGQWKKSASGTSGDLFAAYVTRFVTLGFLAYIAYTTTQSKEGVQQLRSDAIHDREKMQEMREDMKKFVTKDMLDAAERRVRLDLTEQLKSQNPVQATQDRR